MAQLGSTNVYGDLSVTGNISEGGTLLSNKYLGISAKAASASSADTAGSAGYADSAGSAGSVAWANVSGKPSFATVATSGSYGDLSGTPSSLPASDVSPWAKASLKPSYTASEVGAAASDHTHTLSLATDSGTSTVDLAANTKYKITAGGNSVVFKTPADTDTKNTVGATSTDDKLYLLGIYPNDRGSTYATSYATDSNCYVDDGYIYSDGFRCWTNDEHGTVDAVYCNATSSSNYDYPILMKYTNATGSGLGEARFKAGVTINGSTGQLTAPSFMATSALESKENISDATLDALKLINDTKIVNFTFKDDETHTPKIGFIADYTDSLLATPKHDTMDLYNCIGVLMKASQQMSSRIEALEKRVSELENRK